MKLFPQSKELEKHYFFLSHKRKKYGSNKWTSKLMKLQVQLDEQKSHWNSLDAMAILAWIF